MENANYGGRERPPYRGAHMRRHTAVLGGVDEKEGWRGIRGRAREAERQLRELSELSITLCNGELAI